MATYQEILTRGQQTNGVWEHFAPTLTFGTLALAGHQADVAAMPGADQAVVDAEAVIDEKRDLRNAKVAMVEEIARRLPRAAANSLAPEDSLQDDIVKIQGMEMESDEAKMDRGQATLTLWTGANARRAAATPVEPPLKLPKSGGGDWFVADLAAALTAVPALEQEVKNAAAPLSEVRSARRKLARRTDRNNKRWFGAWGAHFPEGTAEHDALSQITTEGGGSGDPGDGDAGDDDGNPPAG
jgi:hypothetical protein